AGAWPGLGGRVVALAALALPWVSPLAYALRADLAALLLLATAPVAVLSATRLRAGAEGWSLRFLAASVAAALLAPPLALAAVALAAWALPRRRAVLAGALALAAGLLALASSAASTHVPGIAGLLAVAAIAALPRLGRRLVPILLPLGRRWPQRVGPAAAALGLTALALGSAAGWLPSIAGALDRPRPNELRLLDHVQRALPRGPVAYLGDVAAARWATALLAGCACRPVEPVAWDVWRRGDGPAYAVAPRLAADGRTTVLLLGWDDPSALIRRASGRSAAPPPRAVDEALFGDELSLLGWAIPSRVAPADEAAIGFTALARRAGTYELRLALRDDEGQALAESTLRVTASVGERQQQRWLVAIPANARTGAYRLRVAVTGDGLDLPAPTADGRFVAGTLVVARGDDLLPAGAETPGMRVGATFGERIELVSYFLPAGPLPPGSSFPAILYWRATQPVGEDLPVFLHLVAPDGRLVDQADGHPLAGRLPTSLWQPGEIVRDVRRLALPPDAAGSYELRIGFYRYRTLERLRVPGTSDDAWRLARIEVRP
ncbi:MAG: hypothetical protein HY691_10730, partial [Chloroflexi bacterium]|nr:hypothetical protein [Chloroflexota bacterium]